MESETSWPRKSLEATMPKKFRPYSPDRPESASLNWLMLVLCVTSIAISGILAYRELRLESRIASLEARCNSLESGMELSVLRLRRENDENILQDLGTDAPDHRRKESTEIFRNKREITECNCPAGE